MPGARSHVTFDRGPTLFAATVGVLLGLAAMHVLGLHGVQHDPRSGAAHTHAAHEHAAHEFEPTGHEPTTAASAGEECCDHGHDLGTLMLCLTLLAASGISLLAFGRRVISTAPTARPRSIVRRPPAPSTRAGPPPALAFSILRC